MAVNATVVGQPLSPTDYAILEAAKQVFARKGFAATTVDEIAELAGVGKGTVYRHFGNKAELGEALHRHCMDQVFSRAQAAVRSAATPEENLRALTYEYLSSFAEMQNVYRLVIFEGMSILSRSGNHASVRRCIIAQVDIFAKLVAQGIASGAFRDCDPGRVARFIIGSVHTAMRGSIILDIPLDIDTELETIMLCCMEGLKR